jgi:hypothetical protein
MCCLESLLKIRVDGVDKLLEIFYVFYDMAAQGNSCKRFGPVVQESEKEGKRCCNAMALGLFIHSFQELGQCCSYPTATNIYRSIDQVHKVLTEIKIYTFRRTYSHNECNMGEDMNTKLTEAFSAISSPVLNSHRVHIHEQWSKGNPERVSG